MRANRIPERLIAGVFKHGNEAHRDGKRRKTQRMLQFGVPGQQVLERVTARDIELPKEVMLHYYLYCLDIQTGKVIWKREFYSGQPPGGRHRKNSFTMETPVTDGKLVYVYVANLGLYAMT